MSIVMHRCLVLFALAACSRSTTAPPAPDASIDAAPAIEDASVPEASEPDAPAEAAALGCEDLTPPERAALLSCASSRIHGLGIHGAFTVRVEMSGAALPRTRTENDIEHKFRDALPGDACDRAAKLLAPRLPCTWDVRGPFPKWTVVVVR